MKVIEISSKEEFIKALHSYMDNETYVFNFPKKKYRGSIKFDQFNITENRTSYYHPSFFHITGKIENNKVNLNIEPHWNTYLLLGFVFLWFMSLIFLPSDDDREFALVLISVGIISIGFWVYRLYRRRTEIISDFIKMANKKTVQNTSL